MLKLINLKKNNGIISAEYDPENSGEIGSVSVDVKSEEVVESTLSKMDKTFPIYMNHAIDALIKMKDEKDLPTEKLIMWC